MYILQPYALNLLYSDMRICESSIKKKYIKKSTEMVAIFRLDFMNIDFTF